MPAIASPAWSRRHPGEGAIVAFLAAQSEAAFSYAEVGATRGAPPAGYEFDDNTVQLGQGAAAYARARAALRAWRMFPAPWTEIHTDRTALRPGQPVAMLARALGGWWLNACRVVYVIEEDGGPVRRFGFAYGTLPAHVEQGEEFFCVEWRADDSVWYRVQAFSRPRYWPVRLAKPLARALQRKFVRDSKAAMVQAVSTPA